MAYSVSYVYQLVDKYSAPLRKVRRATAKFSKTAKRASISAKKLSDKMVSFQGAAMAAAGAIGGAQIMGTFIDFETAINKLNAVTLATSVQMLRMTATARELGSTTQFSAGQAAEGMTFLAMAGLNTDQVLQAIPGTLQLAAAGGMDLATAADIATNVLAQMGLGVESLTRVNDNLAMVQARANTSVYEAAEAMKNVGTTSSSLGISLEQTTAMIGAMANAGVKGGEAGTLLRNTLLRLVNPSTKAQKVFRKLGIDMKDFVTPEGKIKNFTGLLDQLTASGANTAQIFTVFDERGGRAIQALQRSGGPAIEELTRTLEQAGGTAEKMAKIQMKGLPGVMKELKSAIEAVSIALFKTGLDVFLGKIFKGIATFARGLATSSGPLLAFIASMGLLAVILPTVLIAVGFLISAFSTIAGALAAVTAPVWGTVAAVIAGVAVFGIWVAKSAKLRGALKKMFVAFKPVLDAIKMFWGLLKDSGAIDAVMASLKWLGGFLTDVLVLAIKSVAFYIKAMLAPLRLVIAGIDKVQKFFGGGDKVIEVPVVPKTANIPVVSPKTANIPVVPAKKANIPASSGSVAADNAKATAGSLNGSIELNAPPGVVKRAEFNKTMPGNLGLNMAGAN